ncbi:MAG TPA: DUF6247 family protein [Microlunatus sp.]|nr:DUF6247 family protein [Microlunatus sp.]
MTVDGAAQFASEHRAALQPTAATFDLSESEPVLDRWWGIAHLRLNPPTAEERGLVRRLNAGEDVGWSSPQERLGAHGRGMAGYALGWSDLALDHYLALPADTQQLVDSRIAQLLQTPDGPGSSDDPLLDRWTTTASPRRLLLVYVFRVGKPGLAMQRLIQI